ncbi:UvrD-helicase domain-containing protein [Polymorphospora rubra]|uniref:UvrD-helicase domain-containing protein n=1 Tax=Polymorphospora rubra TaxID=338584 RepID=UPI0033ED1947
MSRPDHRDEPSTPAGRPTVLIPAADWRPSGVDDLEPAAWNALRDPGNAAVVAGPGAGKTEFLAQRATYLLQTGICPWPRRILAISFKRDAAANLGQRVAARVPEPVGPVRVGTPAEPRHMAGHRRDSGYRCTGAPAPSLEVGQGLR